MTKLSFLVSFIFAASSLQAQYAGGGVPNSAAIGGQNNTVSARVFAQLIGSIDDASEKRKEIMLTDIKGSPYTSNQFAPTVLFYESDRVGEVFYRHNALNDEIEVKKTGLPEEGFGALSRDKNVSILIQGNHLSFNTFITAKNRTLNGYLTKLYDGDDYDLYKRTTIKFTEGQDAQNSFIKAVPARFTQFTEYYFKQKEINRIDQILLKNGKFLKQIDKNDAIKVKKYIDQNDLNVKNEEDLLAIFQFLSKSS